MLHFRSSIRVTVLTSFEDETKVTKYKVIYSRRYEKYNLKKIVIKTLLELIKVDKIN